MSTSRPARPLRLLHLANHHSTNIGNGALVLGTERALREDLGDGLVFTPEPWDDYTATRARRFDESFVERVNRDHDALLVGAAVTFNARRGFSHTGMRFDLPLELWPRLRKPLCFYALSYRVWPGQRYFHLDRLRRTLELMLESPRVLCSVRDDGTKGWLEGLLGRRLEQVDVIPDPTLYVPTQDAFHPELEPDRVNVVLSLNNEDEIYRYGGAGRLLAWRLLGPLLDEKRLLTAWSRVPGWDARRRSFLRRLAAGVESLSRERDVNLILACHTFDDYRIAHEFLSLCSTRVGYQLTVAAPVLRMSRAPYFYDLYAKADLAISMRVHSLTPSIGLGTPTIALSSQPRVSEFMKGAGLEDLELDASDPDLAERLAALAKRCLDGRQALRRRLAEARARLRERSAAYHRRLASFLETGAT